MLDEQTVQADGAAISVRGLEKRFGNLAAVDDVSLEIERGEFLALLGPSGSGKSTILMSLAGFERPTKGAILIDGVDCTPLAPHKRNIGMVFQHYTLFPHMSVRENVAFPLKMRGVAKADRNRRAEAALKTVRLEGFGDRVPKQLSGGQQQRVALARAIVYNPRVLLMDEPLSALDKNLREEMQLEIKRLHSDLGVTVVFVTHDQGEALTMADRVAILKAGKLQQISPARELYERPANLFAAGFIGEMNQIPVDYDGERVHLGGGRTLAVPREASVQPVASGKAILAVRPERVRIVEESSDDALAVTLRDVVYGGAGTLVIGNLVDGTEIRARIPSAGSAALHAGATLHMGFPPDAMLLYAGDGA